MKESLKTKLHNHIKQNGHINLQDLRQVCDKWGYKTSTAERELRPSKSPNIKELRKNGAIIGYIWQDGVVEQFLKDWPSNDKSGKENTQRDNTRDTALAGQGMPTLW